MGKVTAVLFPGQGSQYIGMGYEYCKRYSVAEQTFQEANDILGFDLKKMCFEGSIDELTKTENAQPAILTTGIAAFRVYMKEIGVVPVYAAGHSLGEITALVSSGAIRFSDALKIVRQRGILMKEAASSEQGAMIAVYGIESGIADEECMKATTGNDIAAISNYNSPKQVVISGCKKSIKQVESRLEILGARTIPLKVSAPFHSSYMHNAAIRFEEELKKYDYYTLQWPVISNVNALPYTGSPQNIVENLKEQITKPVRWQEIMNYFLTCNVDLFVDMGPKTILKGLVKENKYDAVTFSLDEENGLENIMEILSGGHQESADINNDIPALMMKCLAIAVCTANSNWDEDEYKEGVVKPYRQLRQLSNDIMNGSITPSKQHVRFAIEILRSVFNTKKTPESEQAFRIMQIKEGFNSINGIDAIVDGIFGQVATCS